MEGWRAWEARNAGRSRYESNREDIELAELLVMVRFSTHDGHGSVELFYEDEPYHLMGKCHFGERKLFVGSSVDIGGKSIGTANDEDKALADSVHLVLHI